MSRPPIGTVDRYIFREFARALLAALAFFWVLSCVIVLFQSMDNFLKHDASFVLGCEYVILAAPQLASQCLPFAVLVGVTFSLGQLSRHQELQAMIIGGYRARRLAWPILASVAVLALMVPVVYDTIVAPAWQEADDIMSIRIKNPGGERRAGRKDIWMLGRNDRSFHVAMYRPLERGLYGVDVLETDPKTGLPVQRLRARKAFFEGSSVWRFEDVILREFQPDGSVETSFRDRVTLFIDETPEKFGRITQKPEEMSIGDLREMIQWSEDAQYDTARYEVYLALKAHAFPFGLVVLSLIGICFSLRPVPGSVSIGLGLSLVLAFAYYGLMAFCVSFAEKGMMGPVFATWLPNAVFGIPGAVIFARMDARI